jgi:ubiquinone/menaquinone biosynthesis C-methylase UbiE
MASRDHHTWTGWRAWLYAMLHRHPASNQAVVDWAVLQPDMDVLDVGCGVGSAVIGASARLPNGTATGVDPSADFVKIARRRSRHTTNVVFVQSSAEDLPFDSEAFDIVWSVHSSHHWRDVAAGIGETLRVLRSGGRLLIVERLDPKRPRGIDSDHAHDLAQVLSEAGFADVSIDHRRIGKSKELLIEGIHP